MGGSCPREVKQVVSMVKAALPLAHLQLLRNKWNFSRTEMLGLLKPSWLDHVEY